MDDGIILLISILIAILLTIFNFTTVAIALLDHKLRSRISNYPVISFLIASTFQGMFAAPITTYKQMEHKEHIMGWVCDLSRVSYYMTHHLVKVSLVIVSFDRLFSIKYPFKYEKYGKKKNMVILLVVCWIITFIVDMLPFIHVEDDEMCHYVANKYWTLSIIVVYNITPFLLISINYILIWAIAAKVALLDRKVSTSLRFSVTSMDNKKSNEKCTERSMKNKGKLQFMLELKATKTSLALMAVYVICWGPLGLYYIIKTFCTNCLPTDEKVEKDLQDGLMYLCFSSNILAPLFYCWLSKEYRKAGKRIMRRFGIQKKPRLLHRSTRTEDSYCPEDHEMTTSSVREY